MWDIIKALLITVLFLVFCLLLPFVIPLIMVLAIFYVVLAMIKESKKGP